MPALLDHLLWCERCQTAGRCVSPATSLMRTVGDPTVVHTCGRARAHTHTHTHTHTRAHCQGWACKVHGTQNGTVQRATGRRAEGKEAKAHNSAQPPQAHNLN